MANKKNETLIQFRMHPRVFAALGSELVTNDVVALIELVKNSYDAFAKNVTVSFGQAHNNQVTIEILDDGFGMDRDTIENVWCLVATPFKRDNPNVVIDQKKRRVSGEKGLGRLSAARLGSQLLMITKAEHDKCWEVKVDWDDIASEASLGNCYVACKEYADKLPFKGTGTLIRISKLHSDWDATIIEDLRENLGRLISPFSPEKDFAIHMVSPTHNDNAPVKIIAPVFIKHPKYLLKGCLNEDGEIVSDYSYAPINGKARTLGIKRTWKQIFRSISSEDKRLFTEEGPRCGEFEFEIRAWDIDADGIAEITENFGVGKSSVRQAISAHKGISVYRDGILILPKSDKTRDWLGLDLRRISKVGTRLSTSQIVGHVMITKEGNPGIEDTSDRERLGDSLEVKEFQAILKFIATLLETERNSDRITPDREKPLKDILGELSADNLVSEVSVMAARGATASDALPVVQDFNKSLESVRKTIEERFVYYSRMATVGTIAQMLVHEIRNRTTILGVFLRMIKDKILPFPKELEKSFIATDSAINSLEHLADTFAPLANRSFKRGKRDSNLLDEIQVCLSLNKNDIEKYKIHPETKGVKNIIVAVDPGELAAVLHNIVLNAIYWLGQSEKKERVIKFSTNTDNNSDRITLKIDDNGQGIAEEDVEKVMWPGVTRKPNGIGMGLTVSAEIVANYNGKLAVQYPGTLKGASFVMDLPVRS